MNKQELLKTIDRVVGTDGNLRIPSWWMHKILNSMVELSAEDKPEDKPEDTDVKKDVVMFAFGTLPCYTIVDLYSGEIIDEQDYNDESIRYNPSSKTLQIFYEGTSAPLVTASRTSIEPFYFGTVSTNAPGKSYCVFNEDRSAAIGRAVLLRDIDGKFFLTIGGNVYEVNVIKKSV